MPSLPVLCQMRMQWDAQEGRRVPITLICLQDHDALVPAGVKALLVENLKWNVIPQFSNHGHLSRWVA